ncbi:MAG TPA: glycosyl hydrolase 115 family protein, partial [Chitinophagaceae bacterium]|nr:glycosyl hydrolase 115 family protein [Chitinophagaceae bacterium]
AYLIQGIKNPFKGVSQALVICGSDRRGTAFGILELSKQIGVSPWYWWADVPVKKKQSLYIKTNIILADAPKVKYRGIFINDEAPALSNWSREKFGGFNHKFYEKVFELMLRLKANYIWPAMWGNAFYYDDSLNIKMADDYAIVIGTSHHEPLMRAHEEWKYFGNGRKWNYDSTEAGLKEYWRGGMQRAWNEKIVSVGMRGDGDEPMSRETATSLLERIVTDQRKIIEEVTGKAAEQTPQLWALYKEVQDYYDKGMRVPDDITLLLCDDNWGNIRKLPRPDENPRKGGYGIYYHFDYVGGPRNYKWLNTNPLPRIWEQMHLAWEYKARQIWIVNVGDIKPMEFPISFFLDYAWNPEKISADDLGKYSQQWAVEQFGRQYAREIAGILAKYGKYNSRRKPELLDANTYSLHNYNEFETVVKEFKTLLEKAEHINQQLPAEYRDAYFQLVLHPVKAMANLYEMYFTVALNNHYYTTARNHLVNRSADQAAELYRNDSLITLEYHRLNNGKWNHMMSQTHIGYTYWQQPVKQKMPAVKYLPQDSVRNGDEDHVTPVFKTSMNIIPNNIKGNIFYEKQNLGVSIESDHFTRAINSNGITWKILTDHGRTGSAITPFPVTAPQQKPGKNAPHLQYEFYSYSKDSFSIQAFFSPTLNIHNTGTGLQYAISVDDDPPQLISINAEDKNTGRGIWNKWVAENIIIKISKHSIPNPGKHTLKYWMVNPGVVLQKLVLDFGELKPSYLGPPETRFIPGTEQKSAKRISPIK